MIIKMPLVLRSLSFEDDIEKEFGENPSRSLGSYRRDHPDFSK